VKILKKKSGRFGAIVLLLLPLILMADTVNDKPVVLTRKDVDLIQRQLKTVVRFLNIPETFKRLPNDEAFDFPGKTYVDENGFYQTIQASYTFKLIPSGAMTPDEFQKKMTEYQMKGDADKIGELVEKFQSSVSEEPIEVAVESNYSGTITINPGEVAEEKPGYLLLKEHNGDYTVYSAYFQPELLKDVKTESKIDFFRKGENTQRAKLELFSLRVQIRSPKEIEWVKKIDSNGILSFMLESRR